MCSRPCWTLCMVSKHCTNWATSLASLHSFSSSQGLSIWKSKGQIGFLQMIPEPIKHGMCSGLKMALEICRKPLTISTCGDFPCSPSSPWQCDIDQLLLGRGDNFQIHGFPLTIDVVTRVFLGWGSLAISNQPAPICDNQKFLQIFPNDFQETNLFLVGSHTFNWPSSLLLSPWPVFPSASSRYPYSEVLYPLFNIPV